MGCVQTRTSLVEEDAIIFAEEALRFQFVDVKAVDAVVRKHSTSGRINPIQLDKIARELNVLLQNSPPHTKIAATLAKIRQFDMEYLAEDWLVLGIMLGRGNANTKASLLYEVFTKPEDTVHMGEMKTRVLKKLCGISLLLGNLVSNQQSQGSNEMKTSNFIEALSQVETVCINKVAEHMAVEGMDISAATFIRVMSTFRRGSLVTSSGWRLFMNEIHSTYPTKKSWTNPYGQQAAEDAGN